MLALGPLLAMKRRSGCFLPSVRSQPLDPEAPPWTSLTSHALISSAAGVLTETSFCLGANLGESIWSGPGCCAHAGAEPTSKRQPASSPRTAGVCAIPGLLSCRDPMYRPPLDSAAGTFGAYCKGGKAGATGSGAGPVKRTV